MKEVNDKNFQSKVIENKKTVLVDFWAPWCQPCIIMGDIIKKIEKKYKNMEFFKYNVDENVKISGGYDIRSIPQLMFFTDGDLIETVTGTIGSRDLEILIGYILGDNNEI